MRGLRLHSRSIELCEQLGKNGCKSFSPLKEVDGTNTLDNTHLNSEGSQLFAKLVVGEIRKSVPNLVTYLREQPGPLPAVRVQPVAVVVPDRAAAGHPAPVVQRHPLPRAQPGRRHPAAVVQAERVRDARRRQDLPQLAHEGEGGPPLVECRRVPALRQPRRRQARGEGRAAAEDGDACLHVRPDCAKNSRTQPAT